MPTKQEYARDPARYRAYNREYLKRYRQVHPQNGDPKQKVRRKVRTALANGTLVKGSCEIINCKNKVEAHHDDYEQPLQVRWLCKTHHEDVHHK